MSPRPMSPRPLNHEHITSELALDPRHGHGATPGNLEEPAPQRLPLRLRATTPAVLGHKHAQTHEVLILSVTAIPAVAAVLAEPKLASLRSKPK